MTQKSAKLPAKTPPHEVPAYGLAEGARYLGLATATLRSWTVGRSYPVDRGKRYFEPLIPLADPKSKLLSFANLIEAHVLWALRTEHRVPVRAVRTALAYAEAELGVTRLLLSEKLPTRRRELFLNEYGRLINLSRSGQYALDELLQVHLDRVVWKVDRPVRFYPFITTPEVDGKPTIAIDPAIAFGRPIVASKCISTAAIVDRIDAGESIEELAHDYELQPDEIKAAIVYQRAA